MPRFTPANLIPLLLLFIFCATNVLASPTLHKDLVYVSDSSDNIDSVEVEKTADGKPSEGVDYTDENADLTQVGNTPDVSSTIRGLLYSSGVYCPNDKPSKAIPSNIPKALMNKHIALIVQSASCSVYDQINTAQTQGAIGAVVYGDVDSPKSQNSDSKIPAFYVKKDVGDQLMQELTNYEANPTTTPQGKLMVRVAMLPSPSSFNGGWQIAIIVIGAVLAASFLVSVLVHCRLYQLRRRERSIMVAQHEANVNSKLKVFTLEKSVLKTFPTKVYNKKRDRISVISSSTKSASNDICSICLEELVDGETLRELPCSHLYHMECVDKWLTTKSSQCPLCKQDTTPPEIAEKREKRHAHTVQIQDRLDNIYDTDRTNRNSGGSKFSRVLEWFGYGNGRESQSRVRPTGGNLFAIQELPPVVRSDNLNRIV